jgi:hypothetical protein
MSRTTLCGITAAGLALAALGLMAVRYHVLGDEVKLPAGPNVWKVTLTVTGHSNGDPRLLILAPLDFNRQHVLRESFHSAQMVEHTPESRSPQRRRVLWTRKAGAADGPLKLRCDFRCSIDQTQPTAPMSRLGRLLYAPPAKGAYLDVGPRLGADYQRLGALARKLTAGKEHHEEQTHALFDYVASQIANEASVGSRLLNPAGAAECLADGGGDAAAKARLLVALLRSRGIPSRLVTGVTLTRGPKQTAHWWVEAWLRDRWVAMCPFHQKYGKVPATYLVFGFGDLAMVRGRHVRDLDYAFLVERSRLADTRGANDSALRRFFRRVSLYMLPPAEQRLVEFLLLLPVASLIVCIYRNLIGLHSFGTFAPALVGLAFRDLHTLPGVGVFVGILLVGWLMRRVLDHYHLLQVPRVAMMLTLVVILLITATVVANQFELPATRYVALFPMVILTGMIERFWTLESEDGTLSSFKTLLTTLLIAGTVALVVSLSALASHLFRYPETLGLIMALQLLIGRYTGYRLMELFRFRDFLTPPLDGAEPRAPLQIVDPGLAD